MANEAKFKTAVKRCFNLAFTCRCMQVFLHATIVYPSALTLDVPAVPRAKHAASEGVLLKAC